MRIDLREGLERQKREREEVREVKVNKSLISTVELSKLGIIISS